MVGNWAIGSSEECDLVIDAQGVSGIHCRLSRDGGGGFTLEDTNSTNGTFVNGMRTAGPTRVAPGDAITLGRLTRLRWPAEVSESATVLTLGRDSENDLVIDSPVVSGRHAKVGWDPKVLEAWIEDVGSANGVSVGTPGLRSKRSHFKAGETVYLGSQAISGAWLFKRLGVRPSPAAATRRSSTLLEGDSPSSRMIGAPVHSVDDPATIPETLIEPPVPIATGGRGSPIAVPVETPSVIEVLRRWPEAVLIGQSVAISLVLVGLLGIAKTDAGVTAFGLSLCAVWFGLVTAMLDGVARPDWLGGFDRGTDLAASIGRLVPIVLVCLGQSLLAWAVVKLSVGLNGPALSEIGLMGLASCAGLALGMLIVAIVRRPGASAAVAVIAMLAMAVLGRGMLAPRAISEATPTRWAYEGLLLMETAATRPADQDRKADPAERYFSMSSNRHGETACALALGLMLLGFAGATAFISWGQPSSASRRSLP